MRRIILEFWRYLRLLWPKTQTTRLLFVLCFSFTFFFAGLIFLFSIGNVRDNYLRDRLAAAYTAALVFEATRTDDRIDAALSRQILDSVPAFTIAMRINNTRHLLAVNAMPPMADVAYDLRQTELFSSIIGALNCLFANHRRVLRLTGSAPMGGDFLEITQSEAPLRHLLRHYALGLFITALIGAILAALILACCLSLFILNPLQRLTMAIIAFGKAPENPENFIKPLDSRTEVSAAQEALLAMQTALAMQLVERRRLAQLGLAIAKINHDLRNLLSAAQLFLDRLRDVEDASVKTLSQKLMHTLDRAIAFCTATLSYGKTAETVPKREVFLLLPLVEEVLDLLCAANTIPTGQAITTLICIAPTMTVYADREQFFRALLNLVKNSFEVLQNQILQNQISSAQILLGAEINTNSITIHILDSGPGIPDAMRAKLFTPFLGSGRANSTGLGLAIAHELVSAQNGTLVLCQPSETLPDFLMTAWQGSTTNQTLKIGAWFCLTLPASHFANGDL